MMNSVIVSSVRRTPSDAYIHVEPAPASSLGRPALCSIFAHLSSVSLLSASGPDVDASCFPPGSIASLR